MRPRGVKGSGHEAIEWPSRPSCPTRRGAGRSLVAEAELAEVEGLRRDPLIHGRLLGVYQRHREGEGTRSSNSLRSGPWPSPLRWGGPFVFLGHKAAESNPRGFAQRRPKRGFEPTSRGV